MEDYFSDLSIENGINKIKNSIIYEVKKAIKKINFRDESDIIAIFKDIYSVTTLRIIFIINDWDYVLKCKKYDKKSINRYLNFLNSFIKNKDYVYLTFITRNLPLKNYEIESYLAKGFTEYSLSSPGWMAKYRS